MKVVERVRRKVDQQWSIPILTRGRWKEVRQLVRDVPVRQTRVAELDDDVAVSSSDVKIERNETWCVDPTKCGSNITLA